MDHRPAYGQETAQAVLDLIRMNPGAHDQSAWTSRCGTQKCVAGWSTYVHGMDTYYQVRDFTLHLNLATGAGRGWEVAGRVLLRISEEDARLLFHGTDARQAIHALEFLAKGDSIDWVAVFGSEYKVTLALRDVGLEVREEGLPDLDKIGDRG